jgi:Ca-activated chloride channel family protein
VRHLILCFLSLAISTVIFAQIPSTPGLGVSEFVPPAATISKAVDEVNLAFTVTDKRGHFISNLGPNDFHLLDNYQAPQRLTFFQQRSDLPLHLAVLIDTSASVEYRFKFETDAAAAFLKKILRPGTDQAFVVAFNDSVNSVVEPTDEPARLKAALRTLKPGGNTALHDAVIYASDKLRHLAESQITRRAIVLISDGVDTMHRSTLQQAEQEASRAEVMIFSLTTNLSAIDENGDGDRVLKELAASTGGTLLAAHDEGRLDSAFRSVQKALRNQYVLAYSPAAFQPDGSYRQVELKALKKGLRTNCRRGYYARPATIADRRGNTDVGSTQLGK